jgi:hypothetical protein
MDREIHIVISTFRLHLLVRFSIFSPFCGISKLLWREQLAKFYFAQIPAIFFTLDSQKEGLEAKKKDLQSLCESNKYKYRSGCNSPAEKVKHELLITCYR